MHNVVIQTLCFAENVLTMKACPPIEEEFVGIFQKIKYSFSLLVSTKHPILEK